MKTSLKFVSLAALTAATLALPAAAQEMKDPVMQDSVKCTPKSSAKCTGKCSMTHHKHHKHHKHHAKMSGEKADGMAMHKCGAKCGAKCSAKCMPKN
jgi:hypothetical protein